jgi:aminomethyltransferase
MKKVPLNDEHIKLGAKMADFADYNMPIQYEGINAEVKVVRTRAGMFDVSHMGEFFAHGRDALSFANYLVTNDINRLEYGDIMYGAMCNEDGGFVDDLLTYKISADTVMFVVNAANIDKDFAWMSKHLEGFNVKFENRSDDYSLIAVQGPQTTKILHDLSSVNLDEIKYYSFKEGKVNGFESILSRTGYTGEDGFELYIKNDAALPIWTKLLETGKSYGLEPAGLGARDVLRLEASYLLYGNDMNDKITPLEASIKWAVKLDKNFIGRNALVKQHEEGLKKRLRGIIVESRNIARHNYKVFNKDGKEAGYVTSGTYSPTLEKSIAMAMLDSSLKLGDKIEIEARNKKIPATIVKLPFFRGSVKSK